MKMKVVIGAAGLAGAAIVLGQMNVGASETGTLGPTVANGWSGDFQPVTPPPPDVIVWAVEGLSNWSETGYRAYSVGTRSCNQGGTPLIWNGGSNQHPVIGQNMFRLKDGRFEQIGQGWLKHGFCALDLTDCGPCPVPTGCASLAPLCSDPYTSGRNGSQGPAGPKYQVNASTGFFPYPPANPPYSGSTARRLRVHNADVQSASNPGAVYWIEAEYIHPQDAPSTTDTADNNASYRKVSLTDTGFASGFIGSTVQKQAAIFGWKTEDPTVTIQHTKVPGEGSIWTGYNVYDNGDGTWDYEYFVYNQNVDRAVGSVSIPVPESVTVTNIGFHAVEYHSGDGNGNQNFSNVPWDANVGGGAINWTTETQAQNNNANAIRWSTGYNFRYTANAAPQNVTATLGIWKPGTPSSMPVVVAAPEDNPIEPECAEDLDGSGDVGFSDILQLLAVWGPCGGCAEDLDGSGSADFADILIVLAAWGPCP